LPANFLQRSAKFVIISWPDTNLVVEGGIFSFA
jgi:hypothetical protein